MALVLGIDLGGTKVLAGVIDVETGKVLSSAKRRSAKEHGPDDLVARLTDAAQEALDAHGAHRKRIKCAGIGVAAQIDRHKGIVLRAPNLANMENVKLAALVEDQLNIPVYLYNDVEAAAAGEAAFGAGAGKKDFFVIFVGTGIGGAIYRDGKPYTGATATAGEVGHIVVDVNGRLCGCGGAGHLEAYASRTAIVRTILSEIHAGRASVLSKIAGDADPSDPGGSGIRSGAIADALKSGDELARDTVNTAAEYLAAGLASVINFYNPPLIIIGGGFVEAVDEFFDLAARRARQAALQIPRQHVDFVKTVLGDSAGIVGAAVLSAGKT